MKAIWKLMLPDASELTDEQEGDENEVNTGESGDSFQAEPPTRSSDYTLTLYLNQYWQDERLAFSSETYELTLSGDFAAKIWVPDTFFANDKNSFLHDVTEKNKMVRLSSDGRIKYGMRIQSKIWYCSESNPEISKRYSLPKSSSELDSLESESLEFKPL
ncbi:gamma-aminobutyric acid receptor subunit beta-like [Trichonephila clavipes]|uniref:Gamma-aminobutyric acid receptor subunit beta-like n=1 Tax=Trichonephila clavipes TaxID=2585209 RepID=A0A8X6SBA5_TRICX|nr:gamma-aminobutyric acid receptor subunit beta-like [Trichonephila clavipes]